MGVGSVREDARTRSTKECRAHVPHRLWPCEHAAATVADNPNGRVAIIEDCGHAVNIDQPDRLNEVLLEFLEQDR